MAASAAAFCSADASSLLFRLFGRGGLSVKPSRRPVPLKINVGRGGSGALFVSENKRWRGVMKAAYHILRLISEILKSARARV